VKQDMIWLSKTLVFSTFVSNFTGPFFKENYVMLF
jgi:hypothetical protein